VSEASRAWWLRSRRAQNADLLVCHWAAGMIDPKGTNYPKEGDEVALREQTLASGLVIRQDFCEAARAIFYQTELADFLYATDGGTLFVVKYRGTLYGLTCKHVLKGWNAGTLFVTRRKMAEKGTPPAPIVNIAYPSQPIDAAEDTDITDICVLCFAPDIAPDFFHGTEYVIDANTIGTARQGHALSICGVLKDKSVILPPDIRMGFSHLTCHDAGIQTSDPTLRTAVAFYLNPAFETVTGISGAPVFDETANRLCGMVARATLDRGNFIAHYIDIFDIERALQAVHTGAERTYYTKIPRS
jgi:hypothetical protein